jgi:hypothetical protein
MELYDLEADPGERETRAETEPQMVARLLAMIRRWREDIEAPVPRTVNEGFDPTFSPDRLEANLRQPNEWRSLSRVGP